MQTNKISNNSIMENQEKYKNLIKLVEDQGYSFDPVVDKILFDFKQKTANTTKEFYKESKKENPNRVRKFLKNKIMPIWINSVEDFDLSEARKALNTDNEFIPYLMGIYIGIHSKNLEENIKFYLKSVLAEMFFLASQKYANLQKK